MKKIVALFVALAFFSSATLFAAPVAGTAPAPQPGASFEVNAFFADVDATQLSDTEAEAVEGEGPLLLILGAILAGATLGAGFAVLGISLIPGTP
jgi:hypothetical protein